MNDLFISKYVPRCFADFKYKEELIYDLKMLIELNEMNIIFVGETGVGKSMLINILINECYTKEEIETHVLVINSLSDLNVVQCRTDLKYFCQLKTHTKKKMVCIDDLDLINESNQQVMRNFIDKYSSNVNFVCTCTNIKKVVEPMYSRLISINLSLYTSEQLYNIFNTICTKEKINIKDDAKKFLITNTNNSIRHLLSIIEKCKLYKCDISIELASKLCTNISFKDFDNYFKLIFKHDIYESSNILLNIYNLGFSVIDIYDEMLHYIKYIDLDEQKKYLIIKILSKYISMFYNGEEHELQLITFSNTLIKSIVKV